MRPDPRLLLPASAVERVPEGMRAWWTSAHNRGTTPRVVLADLGDGLRLALPGGTSETRRKSDCVIDLSAPVGGERLDALEWGLRRLHPDARWASFARRDNRWLQLHSDNMHERVYQIVPTDWTIRWSSVCVIDWPDLSGLTTDDAVRAVVVAALVARGCARD